MPKVLFTGRAQAELDRIQVTHRLPASTRDRVVASLSSLASFPSVGAPLHGSWSGLRYRLGPWPWMLLIYQFDPELDTVTVITIQDARRAGAATESR